MYRSTNLTAFTLTVSYKKVSFEGKLNTITNSKMLIA